jgi:dienelactone hydrolase
MHGRTIGLVVLVALAALPVGAADAATQYTQTPLSIPMTDAQGQSHHLAGRLCVPNNATGKSRLVVINHGSPAVASDRPNMALGSCDSEPAQWFLSRGFAVIYALRRGYGATGGEWAENYGHCDNPDYVKAGLESARDVNAIVDYATRLPQVRPDGAVVAGVSAGGWATDAYNSLPHPKVIAMINMAGGRGGRHNDVPNNNCTPAALARAASVFGKTATTPMIWIYAQNDTFFRPDIAGAMYAGFTAGGARVEFHAVGPSGNEGLYLWSANGGSVVWGPLVEKYLQSRGALAPAVETPPVRTAALPTAPVQAVPVHETHVASNVPTPPVPTVPAAIIQIAPTPKPHIAWASVAPTPPAQTSAAPNVLAQIAPTPKPHIVLASVAPTLPARTPAAPNPMADIAPTPKPHIVLTSVAPTSPVPVPAEAAEIARETHDLLASMPTPPVHTPAAPQTHSAPPAPTPPIRTATVSNWISQSVPKPEPQDVQASTAPVRTPALNAPVRDASVERSRNSFDSSALLQPAQDRLTAVQDEPARVQAGRIVTKSGDDNGDDINVDKGIDVIKH